MNPTRFFQCLGIQKAKFRGAVAHDEVFGIVGQRPSLAFVLELLLQLEGGEVEDKSNMRFPGEADEMPVPIDDPFAKILGWDIEPLDDFPGFYSHLSNGRVLLETRALIQEAVQVEQSLGERRRVMGIGMHYVVAVLRYRRLRYGRLGPHSAGRYPED